MRRAVLAAALVLAGAARAAPAGPSVADVQGAYDAAAQEAGDKHIAGLKILGVQCDRTPTGAFSCQVGFSQPDGDPDRVYLDVALVEADGPGWTLKSGLCRRSL